MTKTLLLLTVYFGLSSSHAQSLDLDITKAKSFKSSIKGNYLDLAIYNNQFLIAASSEETTVFDIATQKVHSRIDFIGKEDKVWLSKNGKYAIARTNYYNSDGADGLHYHDFASGKTVHGPLEAGIVMHQVSFYNNSINALIIKSDKNSEISLSIYNPTTKSDKLIYSEKQVNASSEIPVNAIVSNDDSKIYCYVNYKGVFAKIKVFDAKTGAELQSEIIKHAFYLYETDNYLVCTGATDEHPNGLTTLHDKNTLKEVKRINTEITHVVPNTSIGVISPYNGSNLTRVDLETGKIEAMPKHDSKLYSSTLTFSADGSLRAMGVKNAYSKTPSPDKVGAYVFGFDESKVQNPPSSNTKGEIEVSMATKDSWVTHASSMPAFTIDFPSKPSLEESMNSKNRKVIKLKSTENNVSYNVVISELSSKIKKSKYEGLAISSADNFIKNGGYTISKTESWVQNDIVGKKYQLKKNNFLYDYISVAAESYLYQIIIVSKGNNTSEVNKCFNSFKIGESSSAFSDTWLNYNSRNHKYSIKLPSKPEVTDKIDDNKRKSSTVKSKDNGEIYLILSKEFDSNVSEKEYAKMSQKTASSFAKKTGGTVSDKKIDGNAVSMKITKGSLIYLYKCITTNSNVHQLIYIWEPDYNSKKTDYFFNSFIVE